MIGFFDTSVHVALLRGHLSLDDVLGRAPVGPVRLSPVVASELLRGSRGRTRRAVERLIARTAPIELPSWRAGFLEAGRLLPGIFADRFYDRRRHRVAGTVGAAQACCRTGDRRCCPP